LFALTANAQDHISHVRHFGLEEGLSHQEVFVVHKDSRGFIWLGTKYGLNRYDGNKFKWWTKEKNSLNANEVHHIIEDADGWLWIFSVRSWYYKQEPVSISLVNIHSGEVRSPEEHFGPSTPFSLNDIHTFSQGPDHTLYFTTKQKKLFSYHSSRGFHAISLPFFDFFTLLHSSHKNSIWGTLGASLENVTNLIELDTLGNVLQSIDIPPNVQRVEIPGSDDQQNIFYVCYTDGQLPRLYTSSKNGSPQQVAFTSLGVKPSLTDWTQKFFLCPTDQTIWYKGAPDFFNFHPQKGLIYNFRHQHQNIIDADIHTLHFDEEGTAWLGTSNGLYIIKLKTNPFTPFLSMDYKQYQVSEAYSCRGIWADQERLLINTYKGRMEYDFATSSTKRLSYSPFIDNDGRHTLLMYYPNAVLAARQGEFWFSEYMLVRWNPTTEADIYYDWNIEGKHTYDQNIWSLYLDQKNRLWVGSEKGLGVLDQQSGQILSRKKGNGLEALAKGTVYAFVESQYGHVWIASDAGLFAWTPEEGILERYWTGGEDGYYLPNDQVTHIYEDTDGVLWVATTGGGLIRLYTSYFSRIGEHSTKAKIQHYRQFTIADGLSNNNLYAVYEDQKNHLWISSDYGIIQFNKNTFWAKAFLPKDGLTHHEFNRISHFRADDGRLFFGGLNGVTAFYPNDLYEMLDSFNAPLQITGFQKFDNNTGEISELTPELLKSNQIILSHKDRFFRIEFALLDYYTEGQIRYAWKLEGQDAEWNFINENYIRISGLDDGEYVLKIKGQAANGEWSNQELNIPIKVLKPIYLQNWFLILLGSCLFFFGLLFYKWRTYILKTQKQELERIVNERTNELRLDKITIEKQAVELRKLDKAKSQFFANVSHELRTPLTLILGPVNTMLKRQKVDNFDFTLLKMIQQNGQSLLKHINEILDLSKLKAAKLELQEETVILYPLMRRLVSQFESHAQRKEIRLLFNFFPDQYLRLLLDVKKLEVIINNLLSNAIKFTPKDGQISVSVSDTGNTMRIEIVDNGRGIHPEDLPHIFDRFYQSNYAPDFVQGGTGIGLSLSQELAKMLKGKLSVESTLGEGSCFVLVFPKQEILGGAYNVSPAIKESLIEAEELVEDLQSSLLEKQYDLTARTQELQKEKKRILLVEDNDSLRDYIQMILGDHYLIHAFENGRTALQWLQTSGEIHPPSLIISDVMMPVMDGFQLLEILKSNDHWRSIPVVMLTARAELEDKLKALRIGVDDYIIKPFEEEELKVRIENLLYRLEEKQRWIENPPPLSEEAPSKDPASEPVGSPEDHRWLKEIEALVLQNFADFNFTTQVFAEKANLSRSQLFRRLKRLSGLSPSQYIEEVRFSEARRLLELQQHSNIKAVAYSVGIRHMGSFSVKFKARFGKSPSVYLLK